MGGNPSCADIFGPVGFQSDDTMSECVDCVDVSAWPAHVHSQRSTPTSPTKTVRDGTLGEGVSHSQ